MNSCQRSQTGITQSYDIVLRVRPSHTDQMERIALVRIELGKQRQANGQLDGKDETICVKFGDNQAKKNMLSYDRMTQSILADTWKKGRWGFLIGHPDADSNNLNPSDSYLQLPNFTKIKEAALNVPDWLSVRQLIYQKDVPTVEEENALTRIYDFCREYRVKIKDALGVIRKCRYFDETKSMIPTLTWRLNVLSYVCEVLSYQKGNGGFYDFSLPQPHRGLSDQDRLAMNTERTTLLLGKLKFAMTGDRSVDGQHDCQTHTVTLRADKLIDTSTIAHEGAHESACAAVMNDRMSRSKNEYQAYDRQGRRGLFEYQRRHGGLMPASYEEFAGDMGYNPHLNHPSLWTLRVNLARMARKSPQEIANAESGLRQTTAFTVMRQQSEIDVNPNRDRWSWKRIAREEYAKKRDEGPKAGNDSATDMAAHKRRMSAIYKTMTASYFAQIKQSAYDLKRINPADSSKGNRALMDQHRRQLLEAIRAYVRTQFWSALETRHAEAIAQKNAGVLPAADEMDWDMSDEELFKLFASELLDFDPFGQFPMILHLLALEDV